VKEHGVSIVRACTLVKLSRTAWYRRPTSGLERDRSVIDVLNEIVERKPRWGFWKLHDRLRLDGHCINHKRLHRVYCALGLNLPRRTKRRLPTRPRQPLRAPMTLNETWALDFMADALYGGRWFRTLNVIDEGNRQALGIEVATSIPSARVIRVLEQLIEMHGKPKALRADNGSEFTSIASPNGVSVDRSNCGTSSLVSLIRTPSSSASTGPIAKRCWMHICSSPSSRCVISPSPGSRSTTKNGHTIASAACHR